MLKEFLNKKKFTTNLIYRASKDGFGHLTYRAKMLNKKNLITFIKTEYNKVFGFYLSIPFTNEESKWAYDYYGFMFSLTNKQKYFAF